MKTDEDSRNYAEDDIEGKDTLYREAENYWKTVEPSVNGMLGGFSNLSELDIRDSRKFIKMLQTKKSLGKKQAVDCGSGIGRVSKLLLLPLFDTVDMVDVIDNFITVSSEYLGPALNTRIGEKFTCGLQDFHPKPGFYDLVWIQWVSGHLSDHDLVQFFRRCKKGLKQNGIVALKENIASTSESDFDDVDHSYTRPRDLLLDIFKQAELQVISERKQTQWPAGIYEVRMFALR